MPLQILLLEDSELDAVLIEDELKRGGLKFRLGRIESEAELRRELQLHKPDIILSDHGLLTFSGFSALEITHQIDPGMPFIFVSGSNDQQMIVDMFERGATDYVFKNDIQDLVPAVRHALDDRHEEKPPPAAETDHPELPLDIPAAAAPQSVPHAFGRLQFCPQCRDARDESGRAVRLGDYLAGRVEVVVSRQLCPRCTP